MNRLAAIATAVAALAFGTSTYAVQRTFVASYGSDANVSTNCNFANPCRSFTAALTVTDPGGEIVALDAAGYGVVTITKSVTITANPGFHAGISTAAGNAVTIDTAGVKVILRNLNLNGLSTELETHGVNMTNGASLIVENCVISNFSARGIFVDTAATVRVSDTVVRGNFNGIQVQNGASLDVARSRIINNSATGLIAYATPASTFTTVAVSDSVASGNTSYGFLVNDAAVATAKMSVTRSTASQNGAGFGAVTSSGGTVIMSVGNAMASGNGQGFYNSASTFESLGNNLVRQNASDTVGTITTVPGV